jgi:hypothetical protein
MAKGLTNRAYAVHPVIQCFRRLGRAPQIRLAELASTGDNGQLLSEERYDPSHRDRPKPKPPHVR